MAFIGRWTFLESRLVPEFSESAAVMPGQPATPGECILNHCRDKKNADIGEDVKQFIDQLQPDEDQLCEIFEMVTGLLTLQEAVASRNKQPIPRAYVTAFKALRQEIAVRIPDASA